MAAKGGHIDFMFLAPPYPAAGSDADLIYKNKTFMGSCLGVFKEGDGITWQCSRHRGLGTSHTGVLQGYVSKNSRVLYEIKGSPSTVLKLVHTAHGM